jgi:prepilin-type N-terminal cleavage/methylation domain-containing protein
MKRKQSWLEIVKKEGGFTLLEILAAITIVSVVSLAMMAFFVNALSYAKGNQNKTVVVNLARNALYYIEKQDFDTLNAFFANASNVISPEGCTRTHQGTDSVVCTGEDSAELAQLFNETDFLFEVLTPNVNGRDYLLTVEFEKDFFKSEEDQDLIEYLLPIKVIAMNKDTEGNNRDRTEVEGYVSDEKIRKPIEG